jgi:hypothetical protein
MEAAEDPPVREEESDETSVQPPVDGVADVLCPVEAKVLTPRRLPSLGPGLGDGATLSPAAAAMLASPSALKTSPLMLPGGIASPRSAPLGMLPSPAQPTRKSVTHTLSGSTFAPVSEGAVASPLATELVLSPRRLPPISPVTVEGEAEGVGGDTGIKPTKEEEMDCLRPAVAVKPILLRPGMDPTALLSPAHRLQREASGKQQHWFEQAPAHPKAKPREKKKPTIKSERQRHRRSVKGGVFRGIGQVSVGAGVEVWECSLSNAFACSQFVAGLFKSDSNGGCGCVDMYVCICVFS